MRANVALEARNRARYRVDNFLVKVPRSESGEVPEGVQPILWIADFGLASDDGMATTYATKADYRAPELNYNKLEYSESERTERGRGMAKADVYSLGLTIFHVCTFN